MATYYPYLRARRFDVLAVSQAATTIGKTKKVLPIFEPVTGDNPTLVAAASTFKTSGLDVALILNPQVGELVGDQAATIQLLADVRASGGTTVPAFIISNDTQLSEVQWFQGQVTDGSIYVHAGIPSAQAVLAVLRTPTAAAHVFVERATSVAYQGTFSGRTRILLEDGFQSMPRNSDYPPQSFFSDLNLRYSTLKFDGFGDYTTVGARFVDGGGPPYAIAIHVTEDAQAQGVQCNHFLSTTNATQSNQAGKFGEAIAALAAYDQRHPNRIGFSTACQELLRLGSSQHYPGLGTLKKLAVQHHLELMNSIV